MGYMDLIANCSESKVFSGFVYAALSIGVFKLTTLILSYSALLFDVFLLPAVNVSIQLISLVDKSLTNSSKNTGGRRDVGQLSRELPMGLVKNTLINWRKEA